MPRRSRRHAFPLFLFATLVANGPALTEQSEVLGRWQVMPPGGNREPTAVLHATGTVADPDFCRAVHAGHGIDAFRAPAFRERVKHRGLACLALYCYPRSGSFPPDFRLHLLVFGSFVNSEGRETKTPLDSAIRLELEDGPLTLESGLVATMGFGGPRQGNLDYFAFTMMLPPDALARLTRSRNARLTPVAANFGVYITRYFIRVEARHFALDGIKAAQEQLAARCR